MVFSLTKFEIRKAETDSLSALAWANPKLARLAVNVCWEKLNAQKFLATEFSAAHILGDKQNLKDSAGQKNQKIFLDALHVEIWKDFNRLFEIKNFKHHVRKNNFR